MKNTKALERLTELEQNISDAQNEAKQLRKIIEKGEEKRPIVERIKTFSDALEAAGRTELSFNNSCEELSTDEVAYRKIKLIAKVLNEGWAPDWSNSNEYKYRPWFEYNSTTSGFRFRDTVCVFAGTGIGSRLYFKTRELAEYAGRQFESIYNELLK